jgi:acetolactate synthase-1/2/3 large subunit
MATVTKASLPYGPHDPAVPARAIELACQGRPGPVHLDFDPTASGSAPVPAAEDGHAGCLDEVAAVIASARRPVIVAGVGAPVIDGVLATPIPVLTTYKGRGAVPDHGPQAAGIVTGATAEAAVLAAADLIIGIGLDPVELIPAPWPYPAPVVLLGSWPIDDSTYFGDRLAGQVVGDLPPLVEDLAGRIRSTWSGDDAPRFRRHALDALRAAVPAEPDGLTPQDVVTIARSAAPAGTIATIDAGAHMLAAVPLGAVDGPGQLLISNGLSTMGFALPAAVAAAVVEPWRSVVCLTGDGGLGMALAELETLARLRLNVVVVVFNDAALSLIAIKQQPQGQGGPAAVTYAPTDFAAVAAGFGMRSERVADADAYRRALAAAFGHEGPSLLDVRVDPTAYPAILAAIRG